MDVAVVASVEVTDVDVVEVSVEVTDVDVEVGTFGGDVTEASLVVEDMIEATSLDMLPEDIVEVINPVEDKLED